MQFIKTFWVDENALYCMEVRANEQSSLPQKLTFTLSITMELKCSRSNLPNELISECALSMKQALIVTEPLKDIVSHAVSLLNVTTSGS